MKKIARILLVLGSLIISGSIVAFAWLGRGHSATNDHVFWSFLSAVAGAAISISGFCLRRMSSATLLLECPASISQLDPDDDQNRDKWSGGCLRVYSSYFSFVPNHLDPWGRRVEMRFIPLRLLRYVKWLITPFFAPFGIPFTERELAWAHNPQRPRLEVRACVPADFWYALRFDSCSDAQNAKELIEGLSNSTPSKRSA